MSHSVSQEICNKLEDFKSAKGLHSNISVVMKISGVFRFSIAFADSLKKYLEVDGVPCMKPTVLCDSKQ